MTSLKSSSPPKSMASLSHSSLSLSSLSLSSVSLMSTLALLSFYGHVLLFLSVAGVSIEAGNRLISLPTSQIIAAHFLHQTSFDSLLSILNQYLELNLIPECRQWHFRASRFQNSLGGGGGIPSLPLWEKALRPQKCYSRLF